MEYLTWKQVFKHPASEPSMNETFLKFIQKKGQLDRGANGPPDNDMPYQLIRATCEYLTAQTGSLPELLAVAYFFEQGWQTILDELNSYSPVAPLLAYPQYLITYRPDSYIPESYIKGIIYTAYNAVQDVLRVEQEERRLQEIEDKQDTKQLFEPIHSLYNIEKPVSSMSIPHLVGSVTLGLLTIAPLASHAQGYAEGAGLSYELLPLRLDAEGPRTFRADVYRANVILPTLFSIDSSRSVLVGLSLEHLRFSGARPGFPVASVTGLLPLIGYRYRLNPQLELTALALPALNSDLRKVEATDLTWGGVVRASYRSSARRAYRLTLGYRQQFYGPQYVVLLGVDWRLGQRWRAFGDLPSTFTLSYAVSPRAAVGFNLNGINTAYRLQESNRYFQYQQGHYGLFAEVGLTRHWTIRATAAYAVTRRLAVFERGEQWPATIDYIGLGQEPMPVSETIRKGPAFKLALSYRVPAP